MPEKKELNNEQLEKVTGGVAFGDKNIVECEACGTQFDPDTVENKLKVIEESENGSCGYVTYKCPNCNEFHRVKVIQMKFEERLIDFARP